jgi:hypothetical protein
MKTRERGPFSARELIVVLTAMSRHLLEESLAKRGKPPAQAPVQDALNGTSEESDRHD